MRNLIKLWRITPVTTNNKEIIDLSRDVIIASARQCLTKVVTELGLNRTDYVGIPDYVGHCVIDFIGRRATPVPISLLPKKSSSAILIYDQWGWQKTLSARLELRKIYPNAKIIWDRVDSLPLNYENEAIKRENETDVQLFSLSKTLGAGGGGLIWFTGEGWMQRDLCSDQGLVDKLDALLNDVSVNKESHYKIDRFIRNECICNSPDLEKWLSNVNVNAVVAKENKLRRERIGIFDDRIIKLLQNWMQNQIKDTTLPAPGIFPIPLSKSGNTIATEVSVKFGIEASFLYHFNFNDSYLTPNWKKVLAIPLHSEVSDSLMKSLIKYITQDKFKESIGI